MHRVTSREGKDEIIDTILYMFDSPLYYFLFGALFSIQCYIFNGIKKLEFFSLKRENSDYFIDIDAIPKHDKSTTPLRLDKTGIKKDVSIFINNFVKTLKNRPNIDLSNFYRNFHAFCITREKQKREKILGRFYPRREGRDTKIELYTDKLTDALYHELLHMASLTTGPDFESIGFYRTKHFGEKKLYEIGDGLNEGYTELLTRRYFRKPDEVECYGELVNLSSAIELLIGREKMESLYFNGDLLGLIDELSKFISREEAVKLVRNIDIYYYMTYGDKVYSKKFETQIHGEILLTLAKMMIKEIEASSDALDEERANTLMDWIGNLRVKSEVMNRSQIKRLEEMVEEYNFKLERVDTPDQDKSFNY